MRVGRGVVEELLRTGSNLLQALSGACTRGVQVRALFLDPECEQAKIRSRREYSLGNQSSPFTDSVHRDSPLHHDTRRSIQKAEHMRRAHERHFDFATYSTAPVAFMLLTDDALFVEQYHYGKEPNPKADFPTLGKDVPVVEYGRRTDNSSGDAKDPYEIFADHLAFVFDDARASRHSMVSPKPASTAESLTIQAKGRQG